MCENVFSGHPEAIKSQKFFGGHFVFIKCCEICTEAIEMPAPIRLAAGRGEKSLDFSGFCIFRFSLILEYFSTFRESYGA